MHKYEQMPELHPRVMLWKKELWSWSFAHENQELQSGSHVHLKEKLQSQSSFIFMTALQTWLQQHGY